MADGDLVGNLPLRMPVGNQPENLNFPIALFISASRAVEPRMALFKVVTPRPRPLNSDPEITPMLIRFVRHRRPQIALLR